jgi:energy-coupling factor transporter ATP-binding protein EcfA2
MASWFKVEIENLGPFSGKVELELDTPLTIMTGETGAGKSFMLRLLSVLLKNMRSTLDARALEDDLGSEFGHPEFVVHERAEEGSVALSYGGETLLNVKVHSKPVGAVRGGGSMHSEYVEVAGWRGSQPYIDLIEAGCRTVLVTGDACFRELVNSYAQRRGLGLGAVGVEALSGLRKLVGALRSISIISL